MDLNRVGDSFYQDGEFFAEIQRGVRRITAVGKRVETVGVYPLNSCFPLRLSLAQTRDLRPETALKKETAEDLFYRRGAQRAPISLPLRSVGYIAAKHAGNSPQGRTLCVFFCSAQTKLCAYGDFSQTGNNKLCEKPPLRKILFSV